MVEVQWDNLDRISSIDPGTNFGRGRGFVPLKYEPKVGNGKVDNPDSSIHDKSNGFNACGSKCQSLQRVQMKVSNRCTKYIFYYIPPFMFWALIGPSSGV
jgi:hypothetical protein